MKTTNRAPLRALTALAAIAALVAGCLADTTDGTDENASNDYGDGAVDNTPGHSSTHLMLKTDANSITSKAVPSGAHLTYYGGPVISNVKVFTIFWGGTKVNYASQINAFYTGVTNSTYFDWLTEYKTTSQNIGRGSFAGSYNYTGSTATAVTDATVQSTIKSLITSGAIPAPDANTYYAVHFAPGISVTAADGSKSCQVFCAYHSTYKNSSSTVPYVYYGIIPDQGGSCAGGCGSNASTFNNTTSVSSHELIEAVTDPAVGLATANASPLAWYDNTNGEIGDICNAQQGSIVGGDGATYTVQKEFDNATSTCIVSKGTGGSGGSGGAGGSGGSGGTGGTGGTGGSGGSGGSGGTGGSGGGTCSHSECTTGTKLTKTCDSCVTTVCTSDSYCCSTAWDSYCVSEAKSWCSGLVCK